MYTAILVYAQLGDMDRQNECGYKKGVSRGPNGIDSTIFIVGKCSVPNPESVFRYDIGKAKVARK